MADELAGRHVVVTGGAGALGSAVVSRFLDLGATVFVPCASQAELERFALRTKPNVHCAAPIDLTDEKQTALFFEGLPSLWASVHLAGGFAMANIADTPLSELQRLMNLNAGTCFASCRAAVAKIREGGEGGRIVNVAAKPAIAPVGGMVAYAASKAAVASITQCLAEELKDEAIWVNAVLPSIMDTPANRAAMPKADHASWPKVSEVADAIAFLASPRNALTRGALVPVFGRT